MVVLVFITPPTFLTSLSYCRAGSGDRLVTRLRRQASRDRRDAVTAGRTLPEPFGRVVCCPETGGVYYYHGGSK
jgi:hypothetical protein